jgi:MerR family transcriptional regulator/heat shock protein HspR
LLKFRCMISAELSFHQIVIHGDEPLYSISVVARLTNLPAWTLRALDRECIVSPKKSEGKTRLYSNRDVQRLCRVQYLMKVRKVNIAGLRVLAELQQIEQEG